MSKTYLKITLVLLITFTLAISTAFAKQQIQNPNKPGTYPPQYVQSHFQEAKYDHLQFMFQDDQYKYYTTDEEIDYFMQMYRHIDNAQYKEASGLDKIYIKVFMEPKSSKQKEALQNEISIFNPDINIITTSEVTNQNLWAISKAINFNKSEHYTLIFEEMYYNSEGNTYAWSSDKSYTRAEQNNPYKEIYSLEENKYYSELLDKIENFLDGKYKEYKKNH